MRFCVLFFLLFSPMMHSAKTTMKYIKKKQLPSSVTKTYSPKRTFGFDYQLFNTIKFSYILKEDTELVMPVELDGKSRTIHIDKYSLMADWFEFHSGVGVRKKFSPKSGWFFEPILNLGYVRDFDKKFFSIKPQIFLGYMFSWDYFRIALSVGTEFLHKFGDDKNFITYSIESVRYVKDQQDSGRIVKVHHSYFPLTGYLSFGFTI